LLEWRISRRIISPIGFTVWSAARVHPRAIFAGLQDISANGIHFWIALPFRVSDPMRMILSLEMGPPQTDRVVVAGYGKIIRLDACRVNGAYGAAALVGKYRILNPSAAMRPHLTNVLSRSRCSPKIR